MNLDRIIPLSPRAPGEARRVLEPLSSLISPKALDDLRVVVSELVTNSVRHSGMETGKPIHLRVRVSEGSIRIQVDDRQAAFTARPRPPGEDGGSGWGLYLVDRLADRWGRIPKDGVWAELDLPA
jgi:anti-sigma regulatory factor (Ser/Thr protein kinase)